MYATSIRGTRYTFRPEIIEAKATPLRSGDCLAGIAARAPPSASRAMRLADLPLSTFLREGSCL